MKSETAKELLERYEYSKESAIKAVEIAEQELCEKYAADIHKLVEQWETDDRIIDDESVKGWREAIAEMAVLQMECSGLREENDRLRTALSESEMRNAIAQKVIADKNAKRGVASESKVTKSEITVSELTLNQYQEQAMTTCLPSSANYCYMLFGLVEEVGELCGKVSKAIRKKQIFIDDNEILLYGEDVKNEFYEQIKSETSDVLWFVAGLCRQFGWTLEEVAQYNLDKLAARKQSNTIVTHIDH